MNRTKLARHSKLAVKIHNRYNPPFRVVYEETNLFVYLFVRADTRREARQMKRDLRDKGIEECGIPMIVFIEQRGDDGYTYTRIS